MAKIVVIGGGLFGLTAATLLAEAGHEVTVLEKNYDVLRGASLANQNRVHFGYHYPRSVETARECLESLTSFREFFGPAIVEGFPNYYAIAKEGSQVSPDQYRAFCETVGIPLVEEWPAERLLNRDLIAACWRVNEPVFDYQTLRWILLTRAARAGVDIQRNVSIHAWRAVRYKTDVFVNATYAGIERFIEELGLPNSIPPLTYELCVVPIMSGDFTPYGVTVMDGPFCSIVPRGCQDSEFVLYHVDKCVVERRDTWRGDWAAYGLVEQEIIDVASRYLPIVKSYNWIDTWVTTRVVLRSAEKDDARRTLFIEQADGIYSILSGKINTCVTTAQRLVKELGGNIA